MSLLDDIRTEREREGITEGEWLHRDRGLYAAGRWTFEPLRHPEAIREARAKQQAALEKHRRDLDEADRLRAILDAGGTIPNEYATPHREAAE